MGLQAAYAGSDNNAALIEGADGFRYPSEIEWEWAARCGEEYTHAGSDNLDDVAWWLDNSDRETHAVGQKKANACGLFDMSGNVQEWANDLIPTANRVYRGGDLTSSSMFCEVTSRRSSSPDNREFYLGMRLTRPFD